MFQRVGLGGVLTFDNRQAVQAMGQSNQAFVRLTGQISMLGPASAAASVQTTTALQRMNIAAQRLQTSMSGVGQGLRNFAIAALPASLAMKKGVGTAADFQHGMQGVRAILKDVGEKQMTTLADKAKEMGVISVFSAKQSAEAMEYLARAGFNANEIMGAIDQTIFAAAAEEMNLAEASRIVANNVRAFGLRARDAGRVADVLALTSARTNTTMAELAEGMKYAAPIAKQLGVSVESTATSLGLLADSGLQGSMSGTALRRAMLKLASPTGKAAERLEQLGLKVADVQGNFVGMENILRQLQTGLNQMGGTVNRAAAAAELFGLRGVAVISLLSRLDKAAQGGALTFAELHRQLQNAKGSAEEMAKTRLDSLRGQITLLKSSIEAAFIETFEPLTRSLRQSVTDFIGGPGEGLNGVLFVVQEIKKVGVDAWMAEARAAKVAGKELTGVQQIALGIVDAMNWLKDSWDSFRESVTRAGRSIKESLGGEGVRSMTSLAVKIVTVVGIAGPLLLILGLLKMAVGGLATAIFGLGKAMLAVFSPWGLVIAGVVAAVVLLRKRIAGIASVLWEHLKPIVTTVGEIAKNVFMIFGAAVKAVGSLLGWVFGVSEDGTKTMKDDWTLIKLAFEAIAVPLKVINWLVDTIRTGLEKMKDVILWIPRKLGLVEDKAEKTTRRIVDMAQEAGREIGGPIMGAQMASQMEEHIGSLKFPPELRKRLATGTADSVAEGLKRGLKTADIKGMYSRIEGMVKKGLIDGTEAGLAKAIQFYKQTPREYLARQGIMKPSPEQLLQAKHFLARGLKQSREEARQLQLRKQAEIEAQRRARIERLAQMSPREKARFLREEAREAQGREKEVNVNVKNTMCIDGRAVSSTMAKHQAQIQERIGAKSKHWQTKVQREFGATPGTVNLAVGS